MTRRLQGEIGLVVQQDIYRFDDRPNVLFRAGAANSDLPGRIRKLVREMQRHHQNGNRREHFRDLPGHIHPVQVGHLVIEHDQVGRRSKHLMQGFGAVSSFATDCPGLLLLRMARI
jgi:hypothetical protein